jgi:hypothetical protein
MVLTALGLALVKKKSKYGLIDKKGYYCSF